MQTYRTPDKSRIHTLCKKCKNAMMIKNSNESIPKMPDYDRGKELEMDRILECIQHQVGFIYFDEDDEKSPHINIAGSIRLQVFLEKGRKCFDCGLEATKCFAERKDSKTYHVNFYGYNSLGEEILFTKDHILPQAYGGPDTLENLVPMCAQCNRSKQHAIPHDIPKKLLRFFRIRQYKANHNPDEHHFYAILLKEFIQNKCVSPNCNSCTEPGCKFASKTGCSHPEHPRNTSVKE